MNEHDVMTQLRESFSGLHMDTPVAEVFARGRLRRRRQLAGLTVATAATAGAAAVLALSVAGPAHTRSANPAPPGRGSVKLAAFSVASGPGGSTTLIMRNGPKYRQLDPAAVRLALARHGIPALVTVGSFCRAAHAAPAGLSRVVHPGAPADGSDAMVIDGRAMPPGTRLSIGYFRGAVKIALIEDTGRVSCGTAAGQHAGGNTAIRGG